MSNEPTIYDHLSYVQKNLNVPKNRYNAFAKYHYRNCEDIVEAVNKIMPDGCYMLMSDEPIISGDWHYIKATVTFGYKDKTISVVGVAREPLEKKGNDVAQISGASSSYARKYACNGLFNIDDSKDADNDDAGHNEPQKQPEAPKRQTSLDDKPQHISTAQAVQLSALIVETKSDVKKILEHYQVPVLGDLSFAQFDEACYKLKSKLIKPSDYLKA